MLFRSGINCIIERNVIHATGDCMRIDCINPVLIQNNELYDSTNGIYMIDGYLNEILDNKLYTHETGIIIIDSDSIIIEHNTLLDSLDGIDLQNTNNTIVNGCIVGNMNDRGIWIRLGSTLNTIIENEIEGGSTGVMVVNATHILIHNNTIVDTTGNGIKLDDTTASCTSCNITDNIIDNSTSGINLEAATLSRVLNNTVKTCSYGIYLTFSTGNFLLSNQVSNCSLSINLESTSDGNDIMDNTLYGKSTSGDWGINLVSSDNNVISQNYIEGTDKGIYTWMTSGNNTMRNNSIYNNAVGIEFSSAGSEGRVSDNNITMCTEGIIIDLCIDIIIESNNITGGNLGIQLLTTTRNILVIGCIITNTTSHGIYLDTAYANNLSSNTIINALDGIYMVNGADTNNISFNSISECKNFGIHVIDSNDSIIANNSLEWNYYMPCIFENGTSGNNTIENNTCLHVGPTLQNISPNINNQNKTVVLNWGVVNYAENYYIYRSMNQITDTVGLTPIAILGTGIITYTDTVPSKGVYYYRIVAGTSLGNSTLSNEVSVEIKDPPTNDALIASVIIAASVGGGLAVLYVLDKQGIVKIFNKKKRDVPKAENQ